MRRQHRQIGMERIDEVQVFIKKEDEEEETIVGK